MTRRPRINRGRRLALPLALVVTGLVGLVASVAAADQGQAVVSATIYNGTSNGVSTQTVTLGTLSGCPLYSGSSPMPLSGGGTYQPATNSSWAVSTILSCALQVPVGNVNSVQVESPTHGFEAPLTAGDLSDPSDFSDPNSFPLVSVDGSQDQNAYFRPSRGASDNNSSDYFTTSGEPISMAIYENGPPLTVQIAHQTTSQNASATTVEFSTSVTDSSGATIPTSDLTWSWNFNDGSASSTSTESAPQHPFAPGRYAVSVQVSDRSAGKGGTATLDITSNPSSNSGPDNNSGAGNSNHNEAPTGPTHSGGNHPGGGAGNPSNGSSTNGSHPSSGTTQPQTAGGQTNAASLASNSAAATPAAQPTQHASTPTTHTSPRKSDSPATPAGPVVNGLLISDVHPVSPQTLAQISGQPTQRATAPPVREAGHVSMLPIVSGVVLVLGLLGLGAAREIRGPLVPKLQLRG